jgi:predicted HTH domain antitoxin
MMERRNGEDTMARFDFEVPDWVVESAGSTPETFMSALRLAAAMFWYGRGEISQGTGAAIAGLDRTDFLLALSKHKQDIFNLDDEELDHELSRALGNRE